MELSDFELSVSFFQKESEALAGLAYNPGLHDQIFLELAKRVIRTTKGMDYEDQISTLERLAGQIHKNSGTTRIIHCVREEVSESMD